MAQTPVDGLTPMHVKASLTELREILKKKKQGRKLGDALFLRPKRWARGKWQD